MRILLLAHNYRFLATAQRGRQLAEALARRGHSVTLCTVSRASKWRASWSISGGVRNYEGPGFGQNYSGEGYAPLDVLQRIGIALTGRWDVIHMLDHKPTVSFPGLAGKLLGATLIADWVDWWGGTGGINDVPKRRIPLVGVFESWLEVATKRAAHGVVAISTVLMERARDLGIRNDRLLYLPNGADVENIPPMTIADARAKLGVPPERKLAGFLGVSQNDAMTMFPVLRDIPDLWLMITGPANSQLLESARQFGVADRVWQTGFVDDSKLGTYLSAVNLFCLPLTDTAANRGRLAGKLLYYMATGRPTIVSPIGDHKDIVEKFRSGVIADSSTFTDAVRALLADQETATMLGQNARRAVDEHFNWDVLAPSLEAFYVRARQPKASPAPIDAFIERNSQNRPIRIKDE